MRHSVYVLDWGCSFMFLETVGLYLFFFLSGWFVELLLSFLCDSDLFILLFDSGCVYCKARC